MKTHGGRSFLHGHGFGDQVHEFLAPCIYEGEGEMLGMALFKSLVKHHGKTYFQPIGHTLHQRGIDRPSLADPRHLWALRGPMFRYAGWYVRSRLGRSRWTPTGSMPGDLRRHARFAQRVLSDSKFLISGTMRSHQLKLADRQCRMSVISARVQHAIVMLVTSLHAAQSDDPITRAAADAICRQLRRQIDGGQPSDADFRQVTKLGRQIAEGSWDELRDIPAAEILMPYQQD
jgi:hypothetical protein